MDRGRQKKLKNCNQNNGRDNPGYNSFQEAQNQVNNRHHQRWNNNNNNNGNNGRSYYNGGHNNHFRNNFKNYITPNCRGRRGGNYHR